MIKRLLLIAALIAVPTYAYAQPVPPDVTPADVTIPADAPADGFVDELKEDPAKVIGEIVQNIKDGKWRPVAAAVLALLMLGLGRFRKKLKIFDGDRGGAVLVMVLSLGGALATTLASDAKFDLNLVLAMVVTAWTAVGGYTWFKRIIWPKDNA